MTVRSSPRAATLLARALLVGALLGATLAAGDTEALLCAADPVPAATLLFPYVTGKYDPS